MDKYEEMYNEIKQKNGVSFVSTESRVKYLRNEASKILPTTPYNDTDDCVDIVYKGRVFYVESALFEHLPLYAKILHLPSYDYVRIVTYLPEKPNEFYDFYYPILPEEVDSVLSMFYDLVFCSDPSLPEDEKERLERNAGIVFSNLFLKNMDLSRIVYGGPEKRIPKLGPEFYIVENSKSNNQRNNTAEENER